MKSKKEQKNIVKEIMKKTIFTRSENICVVLALCRFLLDLMYLRLFQFSKILQIYKKQRRKMSYNPMIGNTHSRNSYMPEYESSSYKISNQPYGHQPYSATTQSLYNPPTSSQSIALFHIPSDGTNSLYVDGVPNDTTEREVSHIFRPFPGFQCIRLIKKTTSTGREFFLCFVDFENVLQSTIAMNTLQEYRFDKNDKRGLKISYAKESKEIKEKSHKKYK